ncbi:hypothetical protein RchiOBHm_Chr5g0034891 [Rosa chinensis]|uniref:Uncharacterized protein n=1 Tax=Rosa chinensis TaxID=74649 RepID=A0A2P6QB34_ROSCH|nr:hypothetical protein RchiOBHm_Chr5g0034891 [Rosa chinensis]
MFLILFDKKARGVCWCRAILWTQYECAAIACMFDSRIYITQLHMKKKRTWLFLRGAIGPSEG